MRALSLLRSAAALAGLVFIGLLCGTGIALGMAYVPSQAEAFDSLLYLRRQGGLGSFIRALHYHLSSGAVVAAFVWVLCGVLTEEHRERKWEFRFSVVALLLMIGFCFTGYVLPMDQSAYWGTSVRLGIVETVPVVGGMQADMLRGGSAFGAVTLPRFYALHTMALPLILVVFLLLAFRDALQRAAEAGLVKVVAYCVGIAVVSGIVAALSPAPLEPRANPADVDYVPRPEWYFLWLFQFGKYVHGFQWVESALLPAAAIGSLMLLPELRSSLKQRTIAVIASLVAIFGLSALARYEDRDLPKKPEYEEGLKIRAERNWKVECASCHGVTGKGDGPDKDKLVTDLPDFTSADVWDAGARTRMTRVIRTGNAPDMPAFGDRMTEEEITALIDFIEKSFQPRGQ